ncbi:MAG TPA: hypothetical protein IAB50_09990 [Candidatus Faecivicinus avistercoris]|nr:hypothetical protein [Candidatus Faecivicinus avistercoris]
MEKNRTSLSPQGAQATGNCLRIKKAARAKQLSLPPERGGKRSVPAIAALRPEHRAKSD